MKSPFKFLDSYTKDDRDIFFGREREIEELYHRVFESKLMLVYGVSGTGKSSLIHCGLANKFQETDWLPLVIRRGGNILENMAGAIKSASITPQTGEILTPLHFKKAVRSLYLDHYKPVFFVFDQFEELFIFGNKDEKRTFIQTIRTIVDSDIQCRFIFVMREEYMANFTEFERYVPTIFQNRVRIEKMSHINAIEAIKGPCKYAGIDVEEGFAETLLEKLSPDSADVELTFLQVFLDRILKVANPVDGKVNFTTSLLSKVGNISDLLGSFLDEQIALMEEPDLAMTILKSFVSSKGTKRPATESETNDNVKSLGRDIAYESVLKLIQSFVKLRVLRDKDDQGRYELRHDSLAEKIFEKFSLSEKELLEIRQMIENSYQNFLKRKKLLTSDDLIYISNKDSLMNLNSDLLAFLSESRKHELAKIRTVSRLTAISAFVFVLLLLMLAYYMSQKRDVVSSNYDAVKSLSEEKSLKSRFEYALSAWGKNQGVLPKMALIKAFNDILNSLDKDPATIRISQQYKLQFEAAPVNVQFAECSKDNKYIFGYGDSLILIWKINGKLDRIIKTIHFPILDIKMSDDNSTIGTVSTDSLLTVWTSSGDYVYNARINYNKLNTKQIFSFTKEGNIIAISTEHNVIILDPKGKEIQKLFGHKGDVNALDISGDNNFIASASSDQTVIIWYLNSKKKEYDFYNTLTWHKDTVWSVSFSKNSFFVVSSSADSTVRIVDINNNLIDFKLFPKIERYCYSTFSNSNKGIIANYYYEKNPKKIFKKYLAFHVNNPTYSFLPENKRLLSGKLGNAFEYIVFSPDENYLIYCQNNKTYLSDNKLSFDSDKESFFNLMELSGSKHFFTKDGKYILALNGNTFKAYLINVPEIYRILKKLEKVSGN